MRKFALGLAVALATHAAAAQELTVGLGLNVTSIDPHFHNTTPNLNVAAQIFDRLVHTDAAQKPVPGLALSWRILDPTTWEFALRQGVRFSDGSPFEAEDVLASLRRAPNVPNSPSSFGIFTRAIASAEARGSHTVVIRTREPYPLLANDLSAVNIVHRSAESASTAEFNSGRAAIGTGPFRVVSWTPGDRLVVERNPHWWGGANPWARVAFRILTNDSARVAALLAGDVQLIEAVPPADIARLERDPNVRLARSITTRYFFLHPDQARAVSPFVTDKEGRPLERNPLQDRRVRQAISHAVNREAIAERMFMGQAVPAGGVVPDAFFGGDPSLRAPAYDPERARRLLAEAGYPDGFGITLHGPNDRYVNDDQTVQAIAQMLARVGIATRVETMPWASFATRSNRPDFSLIYIGWLSATGEASSTLRSLLATFDRATGMGSSNRGRYSNPAFDAALRAALGEMDDGARQERLRAAARLAMEDQGIVPLLYQYSVWAARRPLAYTARADDQTWAVWVRPTP
ncbi:MAG: ABC transporter substrate-binding protein [Tagaea sp.]|nr:ABC transporter substrate-binding protein [Tagaea sp.]